MRSIVISDYEVCEMAQEYIDNNLTYDDIATSHNLSAHTVSKIFNKRLPELDQELYYRLRRVARSHCGGLRPRLDIDHYGKNRLVREIVYYILDNDATLRQVSEVFDISRTHISYLLNTVLPFIEPELWMAYRRIMEKHRLTRTLHGGEATKQKYAKLNQSREEGLSDAK